MDGSEFRASGQKVVDALATYLDGIEQRRLFPDVEPSFLARLFAEPIPEQPTPLDDLLAELDEKLFPYSTHVGHPGYFGLITPSPAAAGILGDLIASTLNQNVGTYTVSPAATAMERQTLRWLADLVGYGPDAGGNLTSGGMMANLIGVKLARDWASKDRAQNEGIRDRWVVYVSEERHVSIDKAVDVVGVGRQGLRVLPTEDDLRLSVQALEAAIRQDKSRGLKPMCIIAIAGTTNTGAVDPLGEMHRIATREGAWLHVDAAYGGGVLVSEKRRGLLKDLALADSVTIDPHKWFYAPLDAGAVLVKEAARLTASFGIRPPYLTDEADSGDRYQFYVHGLEQSRRFRGLKVWMGFKRYGTKQLGRWVDANIEQAERLVALAEASPEFRSVAPPVMSAVCLRFEGRGVKERRLAQLHARVAKRIEEQGKFWISTTVIKGKPCFRINPVNFRTRIEHIDALFATLRSECEREAEAA